MPLQLLHASQLTVDLPAPIQPLSLNQVHVVSFSITGALVGAILYYMYGRSRSLATVDSSLLQVPYRRQI